MSIEAKPARNTVPLALALIFCSLPVTRSTASAPDALYQPIDPVFESGLTALRESIGLTKGTGGQQTSGESGLRLVIGVKAVEASQRNVYFVELTSTPAAGTNWASESPRPLWHTNRVSWPGSQPAAHTNMTFEFVYRLVPLRVRVFDERARLLNQGQALVPWELMTNSLADACRLCLGLQAIQAMPATDQQQRKEALEKLLGGGTTGSSGLPRVMQPIAGGFLTLGGLFAESISTPALAEICDKAQCVVRLPGVWTMLSTALGAKVDLALDPRFLTDVVQLRAAGEAQPLYRFPADLLNGKRKLVSVEFIVGPSTGAEVMLAGIRSLRAVHPTKPDRQFVAQVLLNR